MVNRRKCSLSTFSVEQNKLAICILLFILALVPRLSYTFVHAHDPLGGDEIEYDALAWGLSQTGLYTNHGFSPLIYSPEENAPTAFRPPGWPFVLSIVYKLFGHSYMAARVFLAALGAFSAFLVLLLAIEIFENRKIAIVAGAAWSLWPASIYQSGTASATLGAEGLALAVSILGVLLLVHASRRGSLRMVAAAGIALGIGALTRSQALFIIPLVIAWIFLAWKKFQRKQAILACIMLLGTSSFIILPWMVRNFVTLRAFTIATQNEPLFLGNNAWARGSYYPFAEPEAPSYAYMLERYPRFMMRSEVEKASLYRQEAISYVLQNPLRMLWLVGRKSLIFFVPLYSVEGGYAYDFAFVFILPLFLLGLLLTVRRDRLASFILLLPIIAAFATSIIIAAHPRYRYLGEPEMVMFASVGLIYLVTRYSWRRAGVTLLVWLTLNLGITQAIAYYQRL